MAKRVNKFKDKVNQNSHKQDSQGSSYGYLKLPKGISMYKEETGSIYFDIIPYVVSDKNHMDKDIQNEIATPGSLWYRRPFKIHRNIGVNKDAVVCPTTFGKRCPICEYRAELVKKGASKEELDALKISLRNLYFIIPIGHKKLEEKIHIWDISQYLFQNLLNKEVNENDDYAGFPDLEDGLTLKVRFEEVSLGTNKFNEANRIDFEKRKKQHDEDILDKLPCLDDLFSVFSYEALNALFLDLEEPEDDEPDEPEDDEPEPEIPQRRRKPEPEPEIPQRRRKPEPEPEIPQRRRKPEPEPEPEDDPSECPVHVGDNVNFEFHGKTLRGEVVEINEENELVIIQSDDREKPHTLGYDAEMTIVPSEKKRTMSPSVKKDECPSGHIFGKDCEKYDECDTCTKWDACMDAKSAK